MRSTIAVVAFSILLLPCASAQGVKDPPNYTTLGVKSAQKAQQLNQPAARPKPIGNLPAGYLPPNVAKQWADRNGR